MTEVKTDTMENSQNLSNTTTNKNDNIPNTTQTNQQLSIDEQLKNKEAKLLYKQHYNKSENETTEQSQEFIEDASNHFKKLNEEKYNFKITEDGLEYTIINPETKEKETKKITNEFEIIDVLSKFFCNEYYKKINMPTVENPKFSNGTEENEEIKKINQQRHSMFRTNK